MKPTISNYMSRQAHTVGTGTTLAEAHRLMRQWAIRHLPVLEGGKLVGVVSLNDLHLLETLKGVNPEEVTVEEAMSQGVYSVPPDAPLEDVATQMAEHKYGSAVVIDDARRGHVIGIFTTTDALHALSELSSDVPDFLAAEHRHEAVD